MGRTKQLKETRQKRLEFYDVKNKRMKSQPFIINDIHRYENDLLSTQHNIVPASEEYDVCSEMVKDPRVRLNTLKVTKESPKQSFKRGYDPTVKLNAQSKIIENQLSAIPNS